MMQIVFGPANAGNHPLTGIPSNGEKPKACEANTIFGQSQRVQLLVESAIAGRA